MPPHRQALFILGLSLTLCLSQPYVVDGQSADPRIDLVSPNPVTPDDVGEFLVIDPGERTSLHGWTLSDGTHRVYLPNETVDGPFALSRNPGVAALLTDTPVHGWVGHLPLAADGDSLVLSDSSGTVVDRVRYGRTRSGEQWVRDGDALQRTHGSIEPLGFEEHERGVVTAFVLPDAPEAPRDLIDSAEERLWIAGYELTDPTITSSILVRHAAGVDVRVLVDGAPVGGQSILEAERLDQLDDAGVPVRVPGGERRRFRYHHPKYAIVDDRAVVMTENWKPAGTGGASSRGWGLILSESQGVTDLATVFETDYLARDTVSWTRRRSSIDPRPDEFSDGEYPQSFSPERLPVDRLQIAVTPAGAETAIRSAIRDADDRIYVQQVQISDVEFPLLAELIAAAERGVRVRILLDSDWYVEDENLALARTLSEMSSAHGLPLEARLVEPAGQFGKIHTKGIIIDGETTVVGSMNWNNVSMRENREVVAIVKSPEVAAYFGGTFDHDWSAPGSVVPLGLVIGTVTTWIAVGLFARRVLSFEPS